MKPFPDFKEKMQHMLHKMISELHMALEEDKQINASLESLKEKAFQLEAEHKVRLDEIKSSVNSFMRKHGQEELAPSQEHGGV